jgi:uncharacterized protein (TIGR03437 family)
MGIRQIALVALITVLLPDAAQRSGYLKYDPHAGPAQWKGLHLSRPTPLLFTLSAATTVTISLSRLNDVVYTIGGPAPPVQNLQVQSIQGQPFSFTAGSTTPQWLSVSPASGTAPATVAVSINPAGLNVGQYSGQVIVNSPDAINGPQFASIALTIVPAPCSAPTISIQPTSRAIISNQTATLTVLANGTAPLTYQWYQGSKGDISNPAGGNSAAFTTPPMTVTTSFWVRITNGCGTVDSLAATVQVLVNLSVSPSLLNFAYQSGGNLPQVQSVTVSASSAAAFTAATSGGGWLTVSPTTASAPASLSVSVNPTGLDPGTYYGTITVTPSAANNSPQTVSVTLTVSAAATLTISPATLSFVFQIGGVAPAAQSLSLGSSGTALPFSASATTTSGGSWLSVAQNTGTTPANLGVSVKPAGLGTGLYSGNITINSPGAPGNSHSILVTLDISAPSLPLPTITAVVNAASFQRGPISPGEIITIGGTALGPSSPAGLALDQDGKVSTQVSGVQVLFSGFPSPLTYVSSTQINAVVPYELNGLSSPYVQVKYQGQTSNAFSLEATAAAPALFTFDGSGTGPAAVLNQDQSYNTPHNPASEGSYIVLYMTGEGQTSPAGGTGRVTTVSATPPLTPQPLLPVAVIIGGQPAFVAFYGEAPGFVSGVMQLNVQIPANVPAGDLPILVSVGDSKSQNGVTVSVN